MLPANTKQGFKLQLNLFTRYATVWVFLMLIMVIAPRLNGQTQFGVYDANSTRLTGTNGNWVTFKPSFPSDLGTVETQIFSMPSKGMGVIGVEFKLVGADGGTAQSSFNLVNSFANGGQGSNVNFSIPVERRAAA